MLFLALGVYFGSRIPIAAARGPNPAFIEAWLTIIALLVVLLVLALLDWVATRSYARRQRRFMARQRHQLLRDVFGKRPAEHTGHATEGDQTPD
jgi:hypothetical protein